MTTTDNTAVIRQLEREVELVRDKYRTEQSLRAQEERGRIEAQTQLEHIRRGADMYGVMQSMALQGKKHPKEPHMDGRLDAIRSLVAHNAKLVAELAEMQRLYERATRQTMEAERRADRLENKNTCKACKGTGYRSAGGDKIGTWPCEHCRSIDAMNQWR